MRHLIVKDIKRIKRYRQYELKVLCLKYLAAEQLLGIGENVFFENELSKASILSNRFKIKSRSLGIGRSSFMLKNLNLSRMDFSSRVVYGSLNGIKKHSW